MQDFTHLESDLWEAADQLRANAKVTSNQYCIPVLGIIFLRHACNRFEYASKLIEADQASGKMPKRKVTKADFTVRRALWLPEKARYDYLLALPSEANRAQAVIDAMNAIEEEHPILLGVLPKDYVIFKSDVMEDLLKIFNRDALKQANGDLFGRIYEYFLMEFAGQKAHDDGEFFTPPSIVQTIVNVIEPDHGKVFDPACGSGGMFVQTSHFIERSGQDTAKKVIFYGQEKTDTTIKLAKMNLAVHGLEGNIRDANTFEEDAFTLFGKCDFVMANPPFNVDMVDAEKVKGDKRLPFGLPGVNKEKKVTNGNYLWISYFHSYLNETGRAGFVMSSQASSAGHGEKEVRRKIVQTGDVDVMMAIRGNFFYTRTVPCELWFFDKNKPKALKDKVLMLDARNIYHKVSRRIYDFSPEQLNNLSAIIWLYRGQNDRFLNLITYYFEVGCREAGQVQGCLDIFDKQVEAITVVLSAFQKATEQIKGLDQAKTKAFVDAQTELAETLRAYASDRKVLLEELAGYLKKIKPKTLQTNNDQRDARKDFEPMAERLKGLVKQVDLIYKLAIRSSGNAMEVAGDEKVKELLDRRAFSRSVKDLEDIRMSAVEQLKMAGYFHKQVGWLQDRFPKAELQPVPGLVKLVDRKEIEKADWILTPGRYVGVAPPEVDLDFDFSQTMEDIKTEIEELDKDARELSEKIIIGLREIV